MSCCVSAYAIGLEPDAERILRVVLKAIRAGAARLAAAPTRLSRPGHEENWPYYSQHQRYAFDEGDLRITLSFQYAVDEQHLHITDVSVLPLPEE
jgi:hypothetical protein